ncbi:polymerase delta-interacting protein 3-like [Anastrepha ludens]|uniref:polymerase delta-interacting protein 3-like n=1 Tax=Anastrepha ludens TaxID=28586 RepID=UPI0023AEBADF|nr:polymerase delta-interacting protein 3-like [Anastrepha ludens]
MDLSLDEIIKTKKIARPSAVKKFNNSENPRKGLTLRKTLNKPIFKQSIVTDARNKIIQKNREKIRDARDKLSELTRASGDVRQRLLAKKLSLGGGLKTRGAAKKLYTTAYRNGVLKPRPGLKSTQPFIRQPAHVSARLPDLINVPRGYVDYDDMERLEEEEIAAATRLSRTVTNDFASYGQHELSPPPPTRRLNSWIAPSDVFDPFDVYKPRERHMSPQLPPPPPKGILRPSTRQLSPDIYQRRYVPEPSSHLSYEMRSRLERAPDPHASMGIFSNPLKSSSSSGYRIVVSNLHSSVSQSDIQELFEDIGPLYDSRLVRPGVAEVIYKSLTDAEKAVDTYHNRQLDGQPMKCLLVNPRASNKPTAPAIPSTSSSRSSSGKTPLEIDIDALHKVLFRRH